MEGVRTFFRRHHLSVHEVLECFIAPDVKGQSFHETMLRLVATIQLQHQQATEIAHGCFDLRVRFIVACREPVTENTP